MQNLKHITYDETPKNKLISTFYREFIFMTYLRWGDHQHGHVERHQLPQIDKISSPHTHCYVVDKLSRLAAPPPHTHTLLCSGHFGLLIPFSPPFFSLIGILLKASFPMSASYLILNLYHIGVKACLRSEDKECFILNISFCCLQRLCTWNNPGTKFILVEGRELFLPWFNLNLEGCSLLANGRHLAASKNLTIKP